MFGDRLKALRNQKDLSMDELVRMYNKKFNGRLNKSTLSRYENNLQEPMINVAKNIADLFNVSMDYLTDDNVYSDLLGTLSDAELIEFIHLYGELSPDNRSKLRELIYLYLNAQDNTK